MLVDGGATDVTTYFALRLAADGTAATALTITGFDLQYVRSGAAPSVKADATALAATSSAHADNKAIEIDATDQPGLYRVDWPDAAFAAGVREVILTVKVATAFTEHLRVQIDAEVNVVEWGGTDVVAGAIPAFAADAAGGLPVSDAGGLDLDAKLANTNEVTAVRMATLTDWINGGRLDLLLDAIPTTAMRGTDSAALASVCTEVRLAELAAANLPTDIAAIPTTAMRGTDGANTTTPPTVAAIADGVWDEAVAGHVAAGSFGKTDADILADTNELQGDNVPGLIAALNDLSSANVLTEINAALDTAISELGVAAPTATPTIRTGLMLLYMALRNKTVVQTSGTDALEIYNNAGTKIAAKLLTDDGWDYTEAEMA